MEEVKNSAGKPKLTYEQLEAEAMKLQRGYMELSNRLRAIDGTSIRLQFLFKVVENSTKFPKEFLEKCVNEITEILTIENPGEPDSAKPEDSEK